MKRAFCFFFVLMSLPVEAQILRPPQDDSIWCQILPDTCSEPHIARVAPVTRLNIPRRIGVVALADDGGYNGLWHNLDGYPNWVAADQAVGYGISAIQLWPMVSLTDEPGWWPLPEGDGYRDMTRVFENPNIDLVLVRPMQHSFSELSCEGTRSAVWEGGDWGEYAEQLYEKFGDIPKTVILLNWEGDWQLWGARCREPNECPTGDVWPSREHEEYIACSGQYDCEKAVCDSVRLKRAEYMSNLLIERIGAIEAVREAHSGVPLTVYLGVVVNHTSDTEQINLTRDVLPFIDLSGVVIGLSHWDKDQTIVEALEYIRDHLHHPRYNMIVAEIGSKVGDGQADGIYEKASEALDWGVQAVFVWEWRSAQYGLVDEYGVANSGMDGILELIRDYE